MKSSFTVVQAAETSAEMLTLLADAFDSGARVRVFLVGSDWPAGFPGPADSPQRCLEGSVFDRETLGRSRDLQQESESAPDTLFTCACAVIDGRAVTRAQASKGGDLWSFRASRLARVELLVTATPHVPTV